MNITPVFWISLAIGSLAAIAIAFRYSRSGSHPRFRPNPGIVGIVFCVLMVINIFLSLLASKIIGKPTPPPSFGRLQSSEATIPQQTGAHSSAVTQTTAPLPSQASLPDPAPLPEPAESSQPE